MSDPRCGTNAGYSVHLRAGEPTCSACKAAAAAYQRMRVKHAYLTNGQPLLVDATGTRRRIQALACVGWPLSELAARLDVSPENIYSYTIRARVRRVTAENIARLYDELWDQPGPSKSAATRAKRKGWLVPLAWDDADLDNPDARPSRMVESRPMFDDIAIERAMRGSEVHLRPAERAEAVRRLTERGFSAAQIADRLRVTRRAVERIRSDRTTGNAA